MTEYIITREQLIEVFDKLHSWELPKWLHELVYARKLFCPKLPEIVRCRDCKYYDGEPDMESLGEKCWRDPNHTGHSTPTVANGFCWRGKRKEVDE